MACATTWGHLRQCTLLQRCRDANGEIDSPADLNGRKVTVKVSNSSSLRQRAQKCLRLSRNVRDHEEAERLRLLGIELDRTADIIDQQFAMPSSKTEAGSARSAGKQSSDSHQ